MPIEISIEQQAADKPTGPGAHRPRRLLRNRRPGTQDRIFFTEQLALLLETGTPLHTALGAISGQLASPGMRTIVEGLREMVTNGSSFSHALARYPELFPTSYVKLVAAAEEGGFLDNVLTELRNMDEKRAELRRTVLSALSYPAFLICFSLFVVIFVLVVVFPKFADMFARIADRLPVTTLVLMRVSHFLNHYWPLLLAGLVAGTALLVWWLKSAAGRTALDRARMSLFGVREIYIRIYLIRSLRLLALSLGNGVSVPDALLACREVVQNRVFRTFLGSIETRVNDGGGFAASFQEARFIPPMVSQMVTTGEETGRLPLVLGRIADHYERELARTLAAFSRLVEPVMLIIMGGVVGLIVSSLILPIFKLSQAVH
jgi:type II secretory pathway component PulF